MKKEKTVNPVFYLFSMCWKYSEGSRKTVVLYWCMFIVAGIIDLTVSPLAFAKVIQVFQDEGITEANMWKYHVLFFLMILGPLAVWAIHGPARVIERNNAFKVKVNYRKFLMRGTLQLPLSWHKNHHSGSTMDVIEKAVRALNEFSDMGFDVIYLLVKLAGSVLVLTYFFPVASVIALVMLVLTYLAIQKFDLKLMVQQKKLSSQENEVSQCLVDALGNAVTVITLRVEESFYNTIVQKSEEPFALFNQYNRTNELKWFIMSMLCASTVTAVLGLFVQKHVGFSAAELGSQLFILYAYLKELTGIFNKIGFSYGKYVTQQAQMHNAEKLSVHFRKKQVFDHVLPKKWEVLEIRNLAFSYSESSSHLSKIHNLRIRHGTNTVVIGETGSGKSTFLSLIRQLENATSVDLSVDGCPVSEGFAGIEQGIALMPQKPEIFDDTVRRNITLGLNYTEGAIWEAIRIACFEGVILKLPDGLETRLGEDGMTLSGGEQQRLALARGILALTGKDIILLDEPTSSLDKATELKVYHGIIEHCRGKTLICCTHNINLLPLFDTVLVFDKGELVGNGTKAHLTETCPAFRRLLGQPEVIMA
jgi:ATP-binding cassette subfamily B protein